MAEAVLAEASKLHFYRAIHFDDGYLHRPISCPYESNGLAMRAGERIPLNCALTGVGDDRQSRRVTHLGLAYAKALQYAPLLPGQTLERRGH